MGGGLGSLEDLVGGAGYEGQEGAVFVGVEGLDEDEQGAVEGEALEAATALVEDAQADVELDIGVMEVVEKVEEQDGVALGADVGEKVEELVAGEGAGEADAIEHLAHGGSVATEGLHEGVGGEPFAARDGVKGPAQGKQGEEVGETGGGAAEGFDEKQAGETGRRGEGTGEDLRECVHADKIRQTGKRSRGERSDSRSDFGVRHRWGANDKTGKDTGKAASHQPTRRDPTTTRGRRGPGRTNGESRAGAKTMRDN